MSRFSRLNGQPQRTFAVTLVVLLLALAGPAGASSTLAPTPTAVLHQQGLPQLPIGVAVKLDKLQRRLAHQGWVHTVVAEDCDRPSACSLDLDLDLDLDPDRYGGPIDRLHIELGPINDHGQRLVQAVDAHFQDDRVTLASLGNPNLGEPLGLDPADQALWSISPQVALSTRQDDSGVLHPVAIDAGQIQLTQSFTALQEAALAAAMAHQSDDYVDAINKLTPFGQAVINGVLADVADHQAQRCTGPLAVLVDRASNTSGVMATRASREAIQHALDWCLDGSELAPWALPTLKSLPEIQPITVAHLQQVAADLQPFSATGAAPFEDGRWARADWPARIAMVDRLARDLRVAPADQQPPLKSVLLQAREQLREQLVTERDRAMGDGRMATAELAQAALRSMVGQAPAQTRSLLSDDAVATWIRTALLLPSDPTSAATLLDVALQGSQLDLVGLSLPESAALLADPSLTRATTQLGAIQANVDDPVSHAQSLLHAWRPSTTVNNPPWLAARALRPYIDQSIAQLGRAPRLDATPSRPALSAPGVAAPGQELSVWTTRRLNQLQDWRHQDDKLPPTTGQPRPSWVAFQAQVQHWSGTVSRTLNLVLPDASYAYQTQADVSGWTYLRNRENPAINLVGHNQFVDKSAVIERATALLDKHKNSDIAALLALGIRARAWDQAMALTGDPADRAREAAALLWLLTGQEAPDLQGIGSVEALAPGHIHGIPGRPLLVAVAPGGQRAVVLRSPFIYEVVDVATGTRLLGPDQLYSGLQDIGAQATDGAPADLDFRPDGRAVRLGQSLIDLDSGRHLDPSAAWDAPLPSGDDDAIVVTATRVGGQPAVQARRRLSGDDPLVVSLAVLELPDMELDRALASPDLRHIAVQIHDLQGATAVAVLSLRDGSLVRAWTQDSPHLGATIDGIAVTTTKGLVLAPWVAGGVAPRAPAPRPLDESTDRQDQSGVPVWGPDLTAEVFSDHAVLYSADGSTTTRIALPAGDDPQLLDDGRVLLTHGHGRTWLTPLPLWILSQPH